jgi:hypothetical protein
MNSLSPQWIQPRENVDKVRQRYKVEWDQTNDKLVDQNPCCINSLTY